MLNLGMNLQRLAAKQVEFTPASLFNNGEAGVWYDPSAASGSLDWRKNLLEYTESFDNSYWDKGGNTSVSAGEVDPNGGSTAFKYNISAPTGRNIDTPDNVITGGKAYTFSLYVKAITNTTIKLRQSGNSFFDEYVSITTAQGWQRISFTFTANSGTRVGFFDISGSTGDRFYIWGAQLEEASTASSYQPILSTFANAFKTAFPSHTLYQDYQGEAPVTAVGQPVGLMLDKSEGLAQGPELVVNGDFATDTWWTIETPEAQVANGKLNINTSLTNYGIYKSSLLTSSKQYQLVFTITDYTSGGVHLNVGGAQLSNVYDAAGTYTTVIGGGGNNLFGIQSNSGGAVLSIDNVSVKEIQGSHATQPTSTKRPIYARHPEGGIRNLLNYTEQFDNGYWYKSEATITPNAILAPDGSTTADASASASTLGSFTGRNSIGVTGEGYTVTVYAKAGTNDIIRIANVSSPSSGCWYNLTSGTVGTSHGAGNTAAIEDVGNGWYRLTRYFDSWASGANQLVVGNCAADNSTLGPAVGKTIYLWGAQVEEATEASNYQKVVTDIDVTESGVGEVYYLKFDGVDDGMQINNLTSPNTPLTALFGYSATNAESLTFRYLIDIEVGRTLCVASATPAGYIGYFDGAFSSFNPGNANAIKVISYDLVEDNAKIRIDGTQEYSDTTYDQKAISNTVTLFVDIYDNNFLGGNMYQTILRAAESTDEEIAKAETYVANKTGLKAQVDGIATLDLNFGNNTYTAKNSNGGVI